MNYRISSQAASDLESIWDFTADRWNADQADRYIDALMARVSWLTRNQALWQDRPDIRSGMYAYPEQSHMIFFRASGACIEILRVLHRRMDVKRHL
ncbi:type II toxin-antitoxin system RelE/ParE family toxin [uncultured Thiodictyon sp.]|uniref:type II toxin-antitoxin system RelE/ParE family toxin n=1 Tax=uncultured Thiodictyon sp. TaxID=1846217 RepID=UPI0025D7839B|nr:type II toxin-antitoxin system RelE/ParE family toxin [uncultured Thiodictyon sp.]